LTASVEASQAALASELEARAKLQQQLAVASEEAAATAKETEAREKTAAAENVAAATEGFSPLPELKSRVAIFKACLKKTPIAKDVDVNNMAAATEGCSGADITNICQRATKFAIRESLDRLHAFKRANPDAGPGDVPDDVSEVSRLHFEPTASASAPSMGLTWKSTDGNSNPSAAELPLPRPTTPVLAKGTTPALLLARATAHRNRLPVSPPPAHCPTLQPAYVL
jgi:hypothetical protein